MTQPQRHANLSLASPVPPPVRSEGAASQSVVAQAPRSITVPRPAADSRRAALTWLTITDETALALLAPQWSHLAESQHAALFVTPEWVSAWRHTIATDVRPRVLTGWDAGGKLAAVWPLGLRTIGAGMTRCRVLEPMGGRIVSGERLDPLIALQSQAPQSERGGASPTFEHHASPNRGLAPRAPDLADSGDENRHVSPITNLLRAVRAIADRDADLLRWAELTATGASATELSAAAGSRPLGIRDRRILPFRRLPASWDELLASMSYNRRSLIRRRERLAAQRHGLSWRLNDEGASLDAAIDEFIELHRRRWALRGQCGSFDDDRFAAFVRLFCDMARRRGWLRLHRLCDAGRTLAAMLVFHFGGRAYYYQGGWDPGMAMLSPGSLCIARAMQSAIDERLSVFDFLRGDEPYKRHWADEHEETMTFVEALGFRGQLRAAAFGAKERIKRGITRVAGPAAWERMRALRHHTRMRAKTSSAAAE